MGTTPESPWVKHGIQTEDSDWRVHVCPSIGRDGQPGRAQDRHVYFFPTKSGSQAALANSHRAKKAKQPGVDYDTGDGVRLSPAEIPGCMECNPPSWVWYLDRWSWKTSPSDKGRAAQRVVVAILQAGYVPVGVPFCCEDWGLVSFREVDRWEKGHDIVVYVRAEGSQRLSRYRLEVKADFPGSKHGLFLQLAERNPLKRH